MSQRYDVIIGGGGPAGLSLAKELSRHFDVLVLEKDKIGKSHRTWYTYQDRVRKHRLEEAVLSKADVIEFRTIYNHHFMKDKCAVVDKDIILNKWIKEGNTEVSQEKFVDIIHHGNGVYVKTNKAKHKAPLFIDCMGAFSPLLWKKNLIEFFSVWSVFGYSLKNAVPLEHPKFLPVNDKYNTYNMLYKTGARKVHMAVFRNAALNINPKVVLKKTFESEMKKYYPKAAKDEMLYGNIMTGKLKKGALKNVLFYGDAGMFTPASCGMGFNQCLQTHMAVAKEVKKKLDGNKLSERQLSSVASSVLDPIAMDFMQIVIKVGFYNNSQEGWSHGVDWLNEMGADSKYWMRNETSRPWLRKSLKAFLKTNTLADIARSVPPKEYYFIVKTAAKILKKFTLSEGKEVFFNYASRASDKRILSRLLGR